MARVNIDILGISELKWMGEFNSDDHYIYYCGPKSLRRYEVVLSVSKRVQNAVQFNCSVVSDPATPWTAAQQASLSITNSTSLLRLMSIELVMPSLSHLLSRSPPTFSLSQHQGLFQ